jgi:hypothetical protein
MGLRQHPHFHCLVTDGVFFPDRQFWLSRIGWNTTDLCEQVRTSVLQSLVARQCLSDDSAAIMKSWPKRATRTTRWPPSSNLI